VNEIVIRDWDYTCADGCCYEWGTTIYVNGKQLDLMWNPEDHLPAVIDAILKELGVEATVKYEDERGGLV
jgi:hypothetical protein